MVIAHAPLAALFEPLVNGEAAEEDLPTKSRRLGSVTVQSVPSSHVSTNQRSVAKTAAAAPAGAGASATVRIVVSYLKSLHLLYKCYHKL